MEKLVLEIRKRDANVKWYTLWKVSGFQIIRFG